MRTVLKRLAPLIVAGLAWLSVSAAGQGPIPDALDKSAAKWVDDTFKKMTLDDKVGQLVVTAANSTYLATDSDAYDTLVQKVKQLRLGGIHLFGGAEPSPALLLNTAAGAVTLGQPLAAASLLNRLQLESALPLLNTGDFEAGMGFRISGATVFPRQMAVGAAGDEQLAFEAARITAIESRAIGVHVNFSPLADVNNNPQNPSSTRDRSAKCPIRSAGSRRRTCADFARAACSPRSSTSPATATPTWIRTSACRSSAIRASGSTGGTRAVSPGLAAGADAVMIGHIELPALDPGEFSPATLSAPIVTGLLRGEMKFGGLIYTDSMGMDAIAKRLSPGDAAVRAIQAGNDIVLHSPDDAAAVAAIKAAVQAGHDSDGADRRVGAAHPASEGAARPVQDAHRVAGRRAETRRRTAERDGGAGARARSRSR